MGGSYQRRSGGGGIVVLPGGGLGHHAPGIGDLFCVGVSVLGLFVLVTLASRAGSRTPGPQSPLWNAVDLADVTIALDWRARSRIQRELARLARGDTRNRRALMRALRTVVRELRRERLSWLYANVRDHRPTSPPIAESTFRRLTSDARARFEDEIVRHIDGRLLTQQADYTARPEVDGEGVVIVSLVVASHAEIVDVRASDARAVERVLVALEQLADDDLVALEVVWTPAAEDDVMSTDALEARHPELRKLTDIGGRVFCGYCRGPYAMELPRCPHCGAPNEAAPAQAT